MQHTNTTTPHHNTTKHNTTTTPHQPPPLSPVLFLSFPPFPNFHSHQRKQQTPIRQEILCNDDRLRSKIGKIQLMIRKNIRHTVTALNRRKTEGNQTITVIQVSQRLIKPAYWTETPKSNICKIQTIICKTKQRKKLKFENPA